MDDTTHATEGKMNQVPSKEEPGQPTKPHRLGDRDLLNLQQLRIRRWMDDRDIRESSASTEGERPYLKGDAGQTWLLTGGLDLEPWQRDAKDAWFANGKRGTFKIVTGAGKTVIALAIAEQLRNEVDSELRVAVVVPTIVLMNQWYETLLAHSNLPAQWIGRLGGGLTSGFEGGERVLLTVLASAHRMLPDKVRKAGIGSHLLLIADEAHRAGAAEMQQVFESTRAFSLGLSATPERDEDEIGDSGQGAFDESVVGGALGGIVYELTPANAARMGILPPFQVAHYGLAMTDPERHTYERLSRSINETRDALFSRSASAAKTGGGPGLSQWCRKAISKGDELSRLAARYLADTSARKRLLYRAEARREAPLALLRSLFEAQPDARVMVFHESVAEVEELFDRLMEHGLPVVMEHHKLPDDYRQESIGLFRSGIAQIVVSPRTLIEGFDVPAADVGIIVASSSSVRQRIQSIGRILRKPRDRATSDKIGQIHIFYMRETTDERIYEKEDWESLIGATSTDYYYWDLPESPVKQGGPPRQPKPSEDGIDLSKLKPGDRYPGRYEGVMYSCDHQGNVRDEQDRFISNPQGVAERIKATKGTYGSFKVTRKKRALLVAVVTEEGWDCFFAGSLDEPFRVEETESGPDDGEIPEVGGKYRGPLQPAVDLHFRMVRGGVISRKVPNGWVNARGENAASLIEALRRVQQQRGRVTRFHINEKGDAFWRATGEARFIARIEGKLDFGEGG